MQSNERKLKILIACINLFFACSPWAAEKGAEAHRRNNQAFLMLKNAAQKAETLHQLRKQLKDIENNEGKGKENFRAANTLIQVASDYGDYYEKFLNGKIIYKKRGSKCIELCIRDLPNPLEGTFDVSQWGNDCNCGAEEHWSISTGYPSGKLPNNKKCEIYIVLRHWVKEEINGAAQHLKSIFPDKWPDTAPVGIFWKMGDWDKPEAFDYYLTDQDMYRLSRCGLLEKLMSSMCNEPGYAGINTKLKHNCSFLQQSSFCMTEVRENPLSERARKSPLLRHWNSFHATHSFNKDRIFEIMPGSKLSWYEAIEDLWNNLIEEESSSGMGELYAGKGPAWRFDKNSPKYCVWEYYSQPTWPASVVQVYLKESPKPFIISNDQAMKLMKLENAAQQHLWQEKSDDDLWRHIAQKRVTEVQLTQLRKENLIKDSLLNTGSFDEIYNEALIRYPQKNNTYTIPSSEVVAQEGHF